MADQHNNIDIPEDKVIPESLYDPCKEEIDENAKNKCKSCLDCSQAFWAAIKFLFSISTATYHFSRVQM